EATRAALWCVACGPTGYQLPWDFDLTQAVCVVVGGDEGVHRLIRQRGDARLGLPMQGRVESLNASAAAAILLYEVVRQRQINLASPAVGASQINLASPAERGR